jgi:hypothetical protein
MTSMAPRPHPTGYPEAPKILAKSGQSLFMGLISLCSIIGAIAYGQEGVPIKSVLLMALPITLGPPLLIFLLHSYLHIRVYNLYSSSQGEIGFLTPAQHLDGKSPAWIPTTDIKKVKPFWNPLPLAKIKLSYNTPIGESVYCWCTPNRISQLTSLTENPLQKKAPSNLTIPQEGIELNEPLQIPKWVHPNILGWTLLVGSFALMAISEWFAFLTIAGIALLIRFNFLSHIKLKKEGFEITKKHVTATLPFEQLQNITYEFFNKHKTHYFVRLKFFGPLPKGIPDIIEFTTETKHKPLLDALKQIL